MSEDVIECPVKDCGHPIAESELENVDDFSCPNCDSFYVKCTNCGTMNLVVEDQELSCSECENELFQCVEDDCDQWISRSPEETRVVCPKCAAEYGLDEDEDDEDDDRSTVEPHIEHESDEETEDESEEEDTDNDDDEYGDEATDFEDDSEEEDESSEEEDENEEDDGDHPIEVEVAPKPARGTKKKQTKTKEQKETEKKTRKSKEQYVNHQRNSENYIDFFLDNPEGVTIDMLRVAFGLDLQQAQYARRVAFKKAESRGYSTAKAGLNDKSNSKIFIIRE